MFLLLKYSVKKYIIGVISTQVNWDWKVTGLPEISKRVGLKYEPNGIKGPHDKSPLEPSCKW